MNCYQIVNKRQAILRGLSEPTACKRWLNKLSGFPPRRKKEEMGRTERNHTHSQAKSRLSTSVEICPSSMEPQNKNQAQNQRLARKTPATRKQELTSQPGQKIHQHRWQSPTVLTVGGEIPMRRKAPETGKNGICSQIRKERNQSKQQAIKVLFF